MTVPAPALLLASAFLHAVWNALLKREDQPQVAVAGVLSVALGMAAIAAFFSPGHAFPNAASFSWALGAGIFEGLYFVTLAAALARVDYGIAYAIARGGAMVVVWPVSVAFLAEPLRPTGALGVAVMGIGLAFANLAGGQKTSRAGLGFAWTCAVSIAGYHVCYERALAAKAAPSPLFAVSLATALPFVILSLRSRTLVQLAQIAQRRALFRWTLAGVLCTGSFLVFLTGLAGSGAGMALTLRNTSVVFAQAIALGIGERITFRQLAGALLILAGAVLVGIGT